MMDPANFFEMAVNFTLQWETGGDMVKGGYHCDPNDPGGATKWGISKRAHPELDIKNLSLDEAKQIYFNEYWGATPACKLFYPSAVTIFDTSVLCGVDFAVKKWDESEGNVYLFLLYRDQFQNDLVQKSLKPGWEGAPYHTFKNGWRNRINDLARHVGSKKADPAAPGRHCAASQ